MSKKHKRKSKNRNAKNHHRRNAPQSKSEQKSAQTEQTQLSSPQQPPEQSITIFFPKRHWSLRLVGGLFAGLTLLIGIIGVFGYEALWPRILINPSPAVSSSISAYRFELHNQAIYPVEVVRADLFVINLTLSDLPYTIIGISSDDLTNAEEIAKLKNQRHMPTLIVAGLNNSPAALTNTPFYQQNTEPGSIQKMIFGLCYTNETIEGHDLITIEPDEGMKFIDSLGQIKVGSKLVLKVTYKLPFLYTEKTDSAFFEVGSDNAGNPIWIKNSIPDDFNPEKFGGIDITTPIN